MNVDGKDIGTMAAVIAACIATLALLLRIVGKLMGLVFRDELDKRLAVMDERWEKRLLEVIAAIDDDKQELAGEMRRMHVENRDDVKAIRADVHSLLMNGR